VEPVAFADNSALLIGTEVDGVSVMSPQDAAQQFGQSAAFVVTIFMAEPLRRQLRSLQVPVVSARAVFFQHPDAFLPYICIDSPTSMVRHAEEILECFDAWADQRSREEFATQIAWHLLEPVQLPAPTPPDQTYFPLGLVHLGPRECFIDCGAYDGDTIRSLFDREGGHAARVIGFEPDPTNFAALQAFVSTLPADQRSRVHVDRVAVYSSRAVLRFTASEGVASRVVGDGSSEVQAAPLDDLLVAERPTFIKMDIEGAEPDALSGAVATIRAYEPTLAICLYHQQDHLWRIPLMIAAMNSSYRLHLRRHCDDCWETICYALPNGETTVPAE
jgi:FkbM family methyltransferase